MYRMLIVFGLALAVLFSPFALFAVSENYNYCAANQGQYAETPKDDESAPYVHNPISNPTFGRILAHCAGVYAAQNADAITAIATVVATLIAVFLGWLAYDQGHTTRSQLRGYVFADSGPTILSEGKAPYMEFAIKNHGATPVRNVIIQTDAIILASEATIPAMKPLGGNPPETVIAPGETHLATVEAEWTFSAEEWAEVVNKKKTLYFMGLIIYRDAFGFQRETRFCWDWDGTTRTVNNQVQRRIGHAAAGNSWT